MDIVGRGHDDSGGASRFFPCFYSPKISSSERDEHTRVLGRRSIGEKLGTAPKTRRNDHPTVKPQSLMEWLVRLVTPPGGVVLDPFTGSGSTGIAVITMGHRFIGIEQDMHFAELARRRIIGTLVEQTKAKRDG